MTKDPTRKTAAKRTARKSALGKAVRKAVANKRATPSEALGREVHRVAMDVAELKQLLVKQGHDFADRVEQYRNDALRAEKRWEDLEERLSQANAVLRNAEMNLARSLGYIDRINDETAAADAPTQEAQGKSAVELLRSLGRNAGVVMEAEPLFPNPDTSWGDPVRYRR